VLDKNALSSEQNPSNAVSPEDSGSEEALLVRRPVTDFSGQEEEEKENEAEDGGDEKASAIDAGLAKFAKKMPMFEPERMESKERPLTVNLDLALYRAKLMARRSFRYEEAEALLQKVWCHVFLFLFSY